MSAERVRQLAAACGGVGQVRTRKTPGWWSVLVVLFCALALICPDPAAAATSDKKRPAKTAASSDKKRPVKTAVAPAKKKPAKAAAAPVRKPGAGKKPVTVAPAKKGAAAKGSTTKGKASVHKGPRPNRLWRKSRPCAPGTASEPVPRNHR